MRFLKSIFIRAAMCGFLTAAPSVSAADINDVVGLWRDEGSILWIQRDNATLQARIIAFRSGELNYLEGEEVSWPVGTPRRDDRNPDPLLRERFIMGLNMLTNYRVQDGRWQGQIYDPRSGNTYSSTMKVDRKGELQMRGYIGIALLGRTQTYQPFDPCSEYDLVVGKEFTPLAQCALDGMPND